MDQNWCQCLLCQHASKLVIPRLTNYDAKLLKVTCLFNEHLWRTHKACQGLSITCYQLAIIQLLCRPSTWDILCFCWKWVFPDCFCISEQSSNDKPFLLSTPFSIVIPTPPSSFHIPNPKFYQQHAIKHWALKKSAQPQQIAAGDFLLQYRWNHLLHPRMQQNLVIWYPSKLNWNSFPWWRWRLVLHDFHIAGMWRQGCHLRFIFQTNTGWGKGVYKIWKQFQQSFNSSIHHTYLILCGSWTKRAKYFIRYGWKSKVLNNYPNFKEKKDLVLIQQCCENKIEFGQQNISNKLTYSICCIIRTLLLPFRVGLNSVNSFAVQLQSPRNQGLMVPFFLFCVFWCLTRLVREQRNLDIWMKMKNSSKSNYFFPEKDED